jgi:hypothetical protein
LPIGFPKVLINETKVDGIFGMDRLSWNIGRVIFSPLQQPGDGHQITKQVFQSPEALLKRAKADE